MPPHPAFFAKKEIYTKYGLFNTNFKVSADYEILLRFLWKYRISSFYIPEVLIKMRAGGRSNKSLKNIINKSFEDYLIVRNNNLGGLFTILQKNFSKLPQFFLR